MQSSRVGSTGLLRGLSDSEAFRRSFYVIFLKGHLSHSLFDVGYWYMNKTRVGKAHGP